MLSLLMKRFSALALLSLVLGLAAVVLASCDLFGGDDGKDDGKISYEITTVLERRSEIYAQAFSPDGQHILYKGHSIVNGGTHSEPIFIMGRNGLNIRKLTDHPTPRGPMVFSPNGSKIFYSEASGFSSWDIFAVNTDGTGRKRLVGNNGRSENRIVAVSPDGSHILYNTWFGYENGGWGAQMASTDGSDQRRLSDFSAVGFLPDGSILLNGRGEGDSDVYIIDANGQSIVNLTADMEDDQSAVASTADGQWILINTSRGIMLMSRNGSKRVWVAEGSGNRAIDLSPDGKFVLFCVAAYHGGVVPSCSATPYYVVNADGTNRTRIYALTGGGKMSFSPDSRHILFNYSTMQGDHRVYQIRVVELKD